MGIEALAKISKGLNVSADYIMFGEEGLENRTAAEFMKVSLEFIVTG